MDVGCLAPHHTDLMGFENISLSEFVNASNQAACNGAAKLQFRKLLEELEGLPRTRERLVFEMLNGAWDCLKQKVDPVMLVVRIRAWHGAVESTRLLDFLDKMEDLLIGYLDMLPQIPYNEPILTLPALFDTIRQRDRSRFHRLMHRLKNEGGTAASDSRRRIITEIEPFLS